MNKFDMYVTFIFLIKIGFIITAVSHIYLKSKGEEKSELDNKILYWKDRFEFIFTAAMSILLIYLFNPVTSKSIVIDSETKTLLYLFGFILLITSKWHIFFTESRIFERIQQTIRD
jgi:uncharacterized membrane protein